MIFTPSVSFIVVSAAAGDDDDDVFVEHILGLGRLSRLG